MEKTGNEIPRKAIGIMALALLLAVAWSGLLEADQRSEVRLKAPQKDRGLAFMTTLAVKASSREWSDRDLSDQDLANLLWAANGLNRPEEGKFTASSAMNAHEVGVYVIMRSGIFLYEAERHMMKKIKDGDLRAKVMPPRPPSPGHRAMPTPALYLVLAADTSKFRVGSEEKRREWGAIDTGIVSQNISLFCAATGLKTRPMASMDREAIADLLGLTDTQFPMLHHPVGYALPEHKK